MMNVTELLLVVGMEESAEVAKDLAKVLRFGPNSAYSLDGATNMERALAEFNDLYAVFEMLHERGVIDGPLLRRDLIDKKKAKVIEHLPANTGK